MPLYSRTKKLLLSKLELTQILLNKMRQRYPGKSLALADSDNPDKAYISITSPDGQTLTCCTDSLYMAYQKAPHLLNDHYAYMLDTLETLIPSANKHPQLLLPVIANQTRIDEIQKKISTRKALRHDPGK